MDIIVVAFNLKKAEQVRLHNSKVAQLIAAIPFLAGCRAPQRNAVTNLGTYILTLKTFQPYKNKRTELAALMSRFRMMNNFKTGDQTIITRGFSLLNLNLINSYVDIIGMEDELKNRSGEERWDKEEHVNKFRRYVDENPAPYMDEVVTLTELLRERWNGRQP